MFTISLSLSLDSRLQVPWETLDTVEAHTIARILFWNSADAPGKNYSVWRAHHCYLRFILDPEEDPLVSFRFNLETTRDISTWDS